MLVQTFFREIFLYFCFMWKFIFAVLLPLQLFGQEDYNRCDLALELCPNRSFTVSNENANHTLCSGCEDDFTVCFTPLNSIWLKFTTNDQGGDVAISLSNANFVLETGRDTRLNMVLFQANVPCNAVSYTAVGNCLLDVTNNGLITANSLPPNTTYFLCLSGTQRNGFVLPATFTVDVTINGVGVSRVQPSVFASMSTTICPGVPLYGLVKAFNCPDQGSYRWYVDDQLIAVTEDTVLYTTNFREGSVVRVETTCYAQCMEIVSFQSAAIQVQSFIISAGPDKEIAQGGSVILESTIPINTIIQWTPTYGLSNSSIPFPIADPEQSTLYTLQVTDTLTGCSMIDYVQVSVIEGLVIPNTFSPNGDGINDTWYIKGLEAYPNNELQIFSRWGSLVYDVRNFNEKKAWDGKVNNGQLQESVYYYVLKLNNDQGTEFNGSITLIR